MVQFQYCSDLHLEFLSNTEIIQLAKSLTNPEFINTVQPDYLILAGDIVTFDTLDNLELFISVLNNYYIGVLYVPGNHEFYGCENFYDALDTYDNVTSHFNNLYFLYNNKFTVEENDNDSEIIVAGSTLWFDADFVQEQVLNNNIRFNYKYLMNDYSAIPDFENVVREENNKAKQFIANINKADVLITHYGVTSKVHSDYINHWANMFYYTPIQEDIYRLDPDYVVHGHMHYSLRYQIADTLVISNPHGYTKPQKEFKYDAFINVC